MQIVIDIPEEVKEAFDKASKDDINFCFYDFNSLIGKAIQNGTVLEPIPDNPTNGDMIKAIFPNIIIRESVDTLHLKYPTVNSDPLFFVQISKKWWNASYERSADEKTDSN